MKKWLIVICGPTASGKTAISIQLARKLNSEIISTDSRQFYKELKIGSAPPSDEELAQVQHHFIADRALTDDFSAGQYEEEALERLEELFIKYDVVFAVGGSGLYINALCDGLDEFPEIDSSIREDLQDQLEQNGLEVLCSQLQKLDPEYYEQVDKQNPQRVIRALEVCIGTGEKYSSFRVGEKKERPFEVIKIGIGMLREQLYDRINLRVDMMIEAGLLDEVRGLVHLKHKNALQTVGYKELFEYFEGKTSLEEAIELIRRNTRRFAKRQMTWFRRDDAIKWFQPNELEGIAAYIESKLSA